MNFKKQTYALVMLLLSLFAQCNDSENSVKQQADLQYKNVGAPIALEDARRWIGRFAISPSVRTMNTQYEIPISQFKALAADMELGLVLHHGFDPAQIHHVVLIPIGNELKLWSEKPIIDANTGLELDFNTAQTWTEHYKIRNEGSIYYHFFGANVIRDILSKPGLHKLQIVPAINDEGKPQLILLASCEVITGRKKGQEVFAFDASYLCPPSCLF